MEWIIKQLKPNMADTFIAFFQRLQFDHSPSWASCYCQFYHTDCCFDEWMARTGADNSLASKQAIEAGEMTGFLAFQEEKCIGWVNANKLSAYPRLKDEFETLNRDQWGIAICYVIDPDYRGRGVATELLRAAMTHFEALGLKGMVALPVKGSVLPEKHYRGRVSTYTKAGFIPVGETEDHVVMHYVFKEAK